MSNVKFALEPSIAVKHSSVSIRPFVSGRANFGLERYNMVVADGVKHRCPVTVIGTGRIKEYITGLNEQSIEMKKLAEMARTDKEKKEEYEAAVKEIRTIVARAEREIGGNHKITPEETDIARIDITDSTFWERVETFKSVVPDKFNEQGQRIPTYWDDLSMELDNHGFVLNEGNIHDLVLVKIAEAGGFSLIARSYEEAVESPNCKFYINKRAKAAGIKVGGKKLRDKAGQELLKLEKDASKMFYVTKLVSIDSLYYKAGGNTTPTDILYDDCSRFIEGEGSVKNKEEACNKFISYCKMDMEELRLRCMVQDGTANRYLAYKPDGSIYYLKTSTPIGKTVADCLVFLKDPLNQDIYKMLKDQVEKDWFGA